MTDYTRTLQLLSSGVNVRAMVLGEFQTLASQYIRKLAALDERFSRISILAANDFSPIAHDFSDLTEKMFGVLLERERDGSADAALNLNSMSKSRHGFSVSFYSHTSDPSRSHFSVDSGGLEITLDGASSSSVGSISITLSESFYDESSVLPSIERLISITLESWPYSFVGVRAMSFQKCIQQPGDIHSGYWMLFLPFNDISECLPSSVRYRRVSEGTLIETTPHPPKSSSPSDVAAGKRVREALDNLGLVWHSTYAIHGWPPDEEEWRYEDFITGAPRGRKYRVRCIDFDGYDAQRNVLLYAKLFRRLRRQRKEWGLRGWDGPVLNEARRQVRAANGTPIEWHIGLEEPAERARTLLADYTDFNDAQLRVIYTPVSHAPSR